jgi:hypothetical protein
LNSQGRNILCWDFRPEIVTSELGEEKDKLLEKKKNDQIRILGNFQELPFVPNSALVCGFAVLVGIFCTFQRLSALN